jgi:NADH-quinone oxidoreductase subunit M
MIGLAVVGILYGAMLALVQKDFWKLLAYATLSSLSFCTLGIYGFTIAGMDGGLLQTVNEGLIGAALFLMFGVLFDGAKSCQIGDFGGVAQKAPRLSALFVIASLSMIGLPLLNGFVGEFLVLSGTFTGVSKGWATIAALGVILSAAYMLRLIQKIFLGEVETNAHISHLRDLSWQETCTVAVLAVIMLTIGVMPTIWTSTMQPALQSITETIQSGDRAPVSVISGAAMLEPTGERR